MKKNLDLGITDGIEHFLTHWKYGDNYEDSTILVDIDGNILAFFDRKTPNIDLIQIEFPSNLDFIIANNKKIFTIEKIKYNPFNYDSARDMFNEKKKGLNKKEEELLSKRITKKYIDYNTNYFDNVKMDILNAPSNNNINADG